MHFFLPFSQTFFRTVVHKFCIPATYSVKYVSLSILSSLSRKIVKLQRSRTNSAVECCILTNFKNNGLQVDQAILGYKMHLTKVMD